MRDYPQNLREQALRALDRGDTPTDIARRLGVSRVWVYNVRNRQQRTGGRTAFRVGGGRRSCLAKMEETIRTWLAAAPTLTLNQLRQFLLTKDIDVTNGALWRQLDKWSLTYKQNPRRQKARKRRQITKVQH